MNYAQIKKRYLCGIDLHANSMYLKILDREGQVLYQRNMPYNFALFKKILTPFLPEVAVGWSLRLTIIGFMMVVQRQVSHFI